MGTTQSAVQAGLEGVVVAETRLSEVDGEQGRLVIAGSDVESLAGAVSFEEVCARLWAPYAKEPLPASLQAALGEARVRAFEWLEGLGSALGAEDGMDALRASVAHVSAGAGRELETSLLLTGAVAVFTGAWARRGRGLAPVRPDPKLSHAADLLRMMTGESQPERAAGLDAYLVTVSDHGLNASTFTARVIASTGSDAVSAVVGAIGALKGPLHGGAPGPVLDMLDGVGRPEKARPWLEAELEAGRRIMGMGHRIYRVRDPRAAVLERAIERLERGGLRTERLALARAVERAAEELLRQRYPDRPLRANVEFYTAVLLDAVGLDRTMFSPTFACGRVAGWLGHIAEQRATGKLIRPASRYVGTMPG
ncbi:citrate synthase [Hyalangium gracile]|uniref:citrate synthase n=1 Tax=Hyalangium gracile TaxID=394092 RepID=UPI001CC9C8B9|nr:citrate synthase [Hyalangium gracile]